MFKCSTELRRPLLVQCLISVHFVTLLYKYNQLAADGELYDAREHGPTPLNSTVVF